MPYRSTSRHVPSPRSRATAYIAIAALLLGSDAAAQQTENEPTVLVKQVAAATRRTSPVTVDGRLDDAAWAAASVAKGFVQKEPIEGTPAEHDTEVRVLYDDDAIYVAARMYDSEPSTIAKQLVRRDELGQADWFAVGFDPRLDQRTGYTFIVSAANVQRDQYLFNDSEEDGAWDAVWQSSVRVDSLGWTAEMRIPLSQLRYNATTAPQTWGINFARRRVRTNEETHFSLMSALQRGKVSQFTTMTGLQTGRAPRRIELRPYAVGGGAFEPAVAGDPFKDGSSATHRAGLDMRLGLGPSFTLDATVNPDFGQVEADPAVINLSAFETFFQERRPFFVEDARIFDFMLAGGGGGGPGGGGGRGGGNRLFYSRRIGRSPTGIAPSGADFVDKPEAASILGAAKLTGRTPGGLSVGAVAAVTGRELGRAWFDSARLIQSFVAEPQGAHGAVRLRQDFAGGASTIGAIFTSQARQLPADRSFAFLPSQAVSGGFDWEHQWKDRTYAFFGYVAGSRVQGDSIAMIRIQRSSNHFFQRPDALRLRVDSSATSISGFTWRMTVEKRRGRHWTSSAWASQVSPGFEVNDLGFSGQQEVLDGGARLSYREITPGKHLRSYRLNLFAFNNWTQDALEHPWSAHSWGQSHVQGSLSLMSNATLLNYWNVQSNLSLRPELADRTGTRGGPMMLSPRSIQLNAELNTDQRKRVVINPQVQVERKALGAGGREEFEVGLDVRASPRLQFSINPKWEQSRIGAQYVASTTALAYAPTSGTRYLFADVERRELSVETRAAFTLSPRLTMQFVAQPLLSSGDYGTYKQLTAPRTFAFDGFAEGTYSSPAGVNTCTGGRGCRAPTGTYYVDFDGNGAADYSFDDADFNVRSLLGNAVLRWEYRPGSTLFVVWQRQQEDEATLGRFDLGRDARALFAAPARNVFLIKASYWLGL